MGKRQLFEKPVQRQTLAERLASEIESMILSNELESGSVLPSEMDLARQYGVSRSVARDATRLLMAKGLVEVQHGRGVFVSDPKTMPFVDVFLLTLKRQNVNSWEFRQLEQSIYSQVSTLVMTHASDEELASINELGQTYLDEYLTFFARWEEESFVPELEQAQIKETLMESLRGFIEALVKSCHNRALELIVLPILFIRTTLDADDAQLISPPPYFGGEVHNFRRFLESLGERDLEQNDELLKDLMKISPEEKEKLQNTPLEKFPFVNQLL